MLRIGLTGGIGCGKSLCAQIFSEQGIAVIDTDEIAHQLVMPGCPLLRTIINQFGSQFELPDGSLNRPALSQLVFNDAKKRKQLEAIIHPAIRAEMKIQLRQITAPYVILVIPLLFETHQQDQVDRVLLVDCSVSTQHQRVLKRPNMTESLFQNILQSQCSQTERLQLADDIIGNDGNDPDKLRQQVLDLHQHYLHLGEQ